MDKVGIIGIGNIGAAITESLIDSDKEIIISNRSKGVLQKYRKYTNVEIAESNAKLAQEAKYIIVCVKPINYPLIASEIYDYLNEDSVIISIAAGYTMNKLEEIYPNRKYVMSMSNTPALVKEAMSAICPNDKVSKEETDDILEIFSCFGKVAKLPENNFAAFTAICGSLPTYIYMFIEAASDAAVKNGMKRKDSYEYIAQTVKGSAELLLKTKDHPAKLKDDVTSPAGTSIEGLKSLENHGFRAAIMDAIDAVSDKYRKM